MRIGFRPVVTITLIAGLASCDARPELPTELSPSFSHVTAEASSLFSHFSGGGPAAGLTLLVDGLTSPVALREAPDGTGRLFIVDQVGQIRVLHPDGTLQPDPYLDVADRLVSLNPGFDERGLLGLAFHPEFAGNGRLYVYYSAPLREGAPAGFNHTSVISEFTATTGASAADPTSERIVLQVDQPQGNHNGGTLEFSPADGYLYISLGDGGGANDIGNGHVEDWYDANAGGNGQAVENLLGAILRIDVDGGTPYAIPADNPFVGREGRDEIYAYGLRNPYRMSFDMSAPHMLLAGDAGQLLAEEVNTIVRGGNYGWNVKEGLYCFNAADNLDPFAECPDEVGEGHPDTGAPLLPPAIAYPNQANPFVPGLGATVIGGYVYRGETLPQFRGRYIFADFSERIFVANPRLGRPGALSTPLWSFQEIHFPRRPGGGIGNLIKGFGQDLAGEVYVLGSNVVGPVGDTGKVFRLTSVGNARGR